jgi:hypothetical protein
VSLEFGIFGLSWHLYGFDTRHCMDDMWQSIHDMAQWQADMWWYRLESYNGYVGTWSVGCGHMGHSHETRSQDQRG